MSVFYVCLSVCLSVCCESMCQSLSVFSQKELGDELPVVVVVGNKSDLLAKRCVDLAVKDNKVVRTACLAHVHIHACE